MAEMEGDRRAPVENKFLRHAGEFLPEPPLRQGQEIKPGDELVFSASMICSYHGRGLGRKFPKRHNTLTKRKKQPFARLRFQ